MTLGKSLFFPSLSLLKREMEVALLTSGEMIRLTMPNPGCPARGHLASLCPELRAQLSLGVEGGEAEGERAPIKLNNYPCLGNNSQLEGAPL